MISRASVQSEWVRRELGVATTSETNARCLKVLPLVIERVELPGLFGRVGEVLRTTSAVSTRTTPTGFADC